MLVTTANEQREAMIDGQLRPNKVNSSSVLGAFETTAREAFLPEAQRSIAYADEDIKCANGRTLIEPQVLARLIQAVPDINLRDCLVLAEPSGYTAALLAKLSPSVICADVAENISGAGERLSATGIDSVVCTAVEDITAGCEEFAPYGLILLPASVDEVPSSLLDQLRPGGVLLTILSGTPGVAVRIDDADEGIAATELFDASVPPLSEFSSEEGFTF